jgi:hypothetical protein
MKPEIKRRAGQTMRVATTFTGVAACAAAFAPAAMAGTGVTGGDGHTVLVDRTPRIRPADTTSGSCRAGTSNWLHLGFSHGAGDWCFGDRGTLSSPNGYPLGYYTSYCGGNNTGSFWGESAGGTYKHVKFGHGTTYAHIKSGVFTVYSVTIKSWSQNDKCNLPTPW